MGFWPCDNPTCLACSWGHFGRTTTSKSYTYLIGHRTTCHSKCVIYVIICKHCGLIYVGQTRRAARTRIFQHVSNIKRRVDHPVTQHFTRENHNLSDFSYQVIYSIKNQENFDLSTRDFVQNETVLSGLLDTAAGGIRTHRIFFSQDLSNSTVIDGFTFTDAHAEGGGIQNSGGGIFNVNSNPLIQNCIFKNNKAQGDGAGIAVLGSSRPKLQNCTFINNESVGDDGAAVYSEGTPEFIDCNFNIIQYTISIMTILINTFKLICSL